MVMLVYSLLLTAGLTLAAPWWGLRMLASGRYRQGLAGRLGRLPPVLRQACAGKRVVWVHAVSVGEVLAVTRLVEELRAALGHHWVVAVSTTTATGQQIARDRLGAATTFWFPLDFASAVRPYIRALKPELLILVESELWPRVLSECQRHKIPVAVVNARISDRSYKRTLPFRKLWLRMAGPVTLWLAQSKETAARLDNLGLPPSLIQLLGNLKYDLRPTPDNKLTERIRSLAEGRPVVIAGSTLPNTSRGAIAEEQQIVQAWAREPRTRHRALLILAPRHPDRFDEVFAAASQFRALRASALKAAPTLKAEPPEILVLDTLGDLAAVYALATVAFIGGSLVPRGGHNPLEAARFGVPVLMGPSYENFREIVEGMRAANAIHITDADNLAAALTHALQRGQAMGQRGQAFFEAQAGATQRTLAILLDLLHA